MRLIIFNNLSINLSLIYAALVIVQLGFLTGHWSTMIFAFFSVVLSDFVFCDFCCTIADCIICNVFTFTVTAVKNDSVEVSEMLSMLCYMLYIKITLQLY